MINLNYTSNAEMKDGTFMKQSDFLSKVESNPEFFRNVKNPSEEICVKFLNFSSDNLEYIENQTAAIVIHALRVNTTSIDINHGAWELCSDTLKHVKEQTPEICLAALKISKDYLKYVNIVEFTDLQDCIKKLKAKKKLLKAIKNAD